LLLRKCIADDFPEDAILGEEFSDVAGSTGYRWILDPIDGTKSFISGVPLYATLVGIEHEGSSQVGVIYIPALDELIFAEIGKGARYCRGAAKMTEPKVSQVETLADACFVTTQISTYDDCNRRQVFRDIEQQASITRTWGDAYGYLLVATGRAEVMIDPIFNIWDGAAILPVIQESGGIFSDWKGVATRPRMAVFRECDIRVVMSNNHLEYTHIATVLWSSFPKRLTKRLPLKFKVILR
jgi:histidinol phosphatase-like enzyme (inositol monophosphatase family)